MGLSPPPGIQREKEMKVYIIIETDNDGRYQSSEVIADEELANEILRRHRESKQGYLFNYNIEEHHL